MSGEPLGIGMVQLRGFQCQRRVRQVQKHFVGQAAESLRTRGRIVTKMRGEV